MYPLQIVSTGCGEGHEVGEYYDSIVSLSFDHDKKCVVRVRLVDASGPTIMHCHTFMHEDHGAMGVIHVIDGPLQPIEPRVQSCFSGEKCDEVKLLTRCDG